MKVEPIEFKQVASHFSVNRTRTASSCVLGADTLLLSQAVAVVRHGERLDSTPEWEDYPERLQWPCDPPLTDEGRASAGVAGLRLVEDTPQDAATYQVILASPFLRCAQTASEMAKVLGLPVVLDSDLGEILGPEFKAVCEQPHRPPKVLAEILLREYPEVEYAMTDRGSLQVVGSRPVFPETLSKARMRFGSKLQVVAQTAASKLMSVIIVTHADAVAAIAGFMKESLELLDVPPSCGFIATRSVAVMEKSFWRTRWLKEPVYGRSSPKWTLHLSEDIIHRRMRDDTQQRRRETTQLLYNTALHSKMHHNDLDEDILSSRTLSTSSLTSSGGFHRFFTEEAGDGDAMLTADVE